jgi:DNA-binding transcriptional LysR family regulator
LHTGSFSEAASVLGVSQPTLSRTIRAIEDVLGRRLFDRTTRSIELTPVGRELRPIAERMVTEFDSAFGELTQFIEGKRGRIVVAALPSVCAVLLPGAIARFRALHPAVQFLIQDGLSSSVVDAIAEGRADIGVTVRPLPADKLLYRPLLADQFGLVCRPDDALAQQASVPWSAFASRPFIAMNPASSVRAMTDAAFLQQGLALEPLYECSFLGTTGNLVAAGLGVTALPRLALRLVSAADLVWRPLVAPVLERSLGMLTQIGRSISPAASQFASALAAEAAEIREKLRSA